MLCYLDCSSAHRCTVQLSIYLPEINKARGTYIYNPFPPTLSIPSCGREGVVLRPDVFFVLFVLAGRIHCLRVCNAEHINVAPTVVSNVLYN